MANQTDDSFYMLDLTFGMKAAGLAYSGTAGGVAATVMAGVSREVFLWTAHIAIILPEFTSTILGMVAFVHMAKAASEDFNANLIRPGDVTMRRMKRPRIDI